MRCGAGPPASCGWSRPAGRGVTYCWPPDGPSGQQAAQTAGQQARPRQPATSRSTDHKRRKHPKG
eukprot:scaffold304392_cov34-Prasinocladus_malaysianus.AAC.1